MGLIRSAVVFILVASSVGWAQPDLSPANPQYVIENKMLVLRFVPMDKKAKVFITGNKVADIDFNKDAKLISVVMLSQSRSETLQVNRQGDYYEVQRSSSFPETYQLVFKTKVRGKTQELNLKVDATKP